MMRYVTVAEVDAAKGLVKLKDDGEDPDQTLETDWVPWMEQAGQTKTWTPPSVGQPMMLFSPSGNIADAIALAAGSPIRTRSPRRRATRTW